ncbi:uncharacterized protein LOC113491811 [Trichoplusia ni]|uniref:Uncharacterized protein LOC113491811 n=1 Tax=Trichoplusia ni TaxID=7111 RepID=A0A7E5V932_TRINI|nr:uncharacterized protein LOC113491811 [Trichoplusia ni]XP_026724780.1 uncharacterized protein LOC113491811 [Trichoplusia ni]
MADINASINKKLMAQIKKSAQKMKPEHKLCVVLFDEMSLKPNVTYNERKDRVSGFVTNGQDTQPEYADHAQVFMIRGLVKNYKQPVACTFSQSATKGPELAKQLKAVITEIQQAGLIVVATVCDQGTNDVNCIKYLLQEIRGILLRKSEEPEGNIILVNNQEIIPLYDPPHLMKCIRNNLITKNIQYKKDSKVQTAKWEHITALPRKPGQQRHKTGAKIDRLPLHSCKIPRMKVKFTTQLFSQTVATNMGYLADKGIISEDAKSKADVILFFDKLFDSVNGSYGKRKKHSKSLLGPATPNSVHRKTWTESKIF